MTNAQRKALTAIASTRGGWLYFPETSKTLLKTLRRLGHIEICDPISFGAPMDGYFAKLLEAK